MTQLTLVHVYVVPCHRQVPQSVLLGAEELQLSERISEARIVDFAAEIHHKKVKHKKKKTKETSASKLLKMRCDEMKLHKN